MGSSPVAVTDLGTFDSHFTFGVITYFAVLKGSLKKQCCNCFLNYLLFLKCSAHLKTRLLFFILSMRQTNAPYLCSSEQVFMAFTKSFIFLQISFICFNCLDGFLIFFLFVITPSKLRASFYRIISSTLIFFAIGSYSGSCN